MTREERKANSIAKALVKALARLEQAPMDPELILEDALIISWGAPIGVKHAVAALRVHYLGGQKE